MNKKKGSGVRGSLRVIIALFLFRPISHISIYVYYRMKAKKQINRKCQDCKLIIPFIPKRVRCIDCHKRFIDIGYLNSGRSNDMSADNDYIII